MITVLSLSSFYLRDNVFWAVLQKRKLIWYSGEKEQRESTMPMQQPFKWRHARGRNHPCQMMMVHTNVKRLMSTFGAMMSLPKSVKSDGEPISRGVVRWFRQ